MNDDLDDAAIGAREDEVAVLKRHLDEAATAAMGAALTERDLRKKIAQATAGVKSFLAITDDKSPAAALARLVLKRLEAS